MEQSLEPTTLRERIAGEFITGVRQNVWSQAAGLAFADRILAMFAKQDPGYRDDVLRTKGAWFIPGTLILLGWEWSWTDTWLTPHIGFTTFKNYQTLRIGWLAFAAGIAWPTKKAMQQAKGMPGNYGRDMAQTDKYGRTCTEARAYLVKGEWYYKGQPLMHPPADLSDQDREDIVRALRRARSAEGDFPFYERATKLAARLEADA